MRKDDFDFILENLPPAEDPWKLIPLDYPMMAVKTNETHGWMCPRCGWRKNTIMYCLRCGQHLVYPRDVVYSPPVANNVDEECAWIDRDIEKNNYPSTNPFTGEEFISPSEMRKAILIKYPYKKEG